MKRFFACCSSVFLGTIFFVCASESSDQERMCLSQIRQLTSSDMGFEKAGEGYFSPDGKKIIFQAVPLGKTAFQIFTMDLDSKKISMVSTGKGTCTCAYFRPDGQKILFASSHESPFSEDSEPSSSSKYVWHLTPYMNIYEADLDGNNLVALTKGDAYHAECAYSPDGKKIVYASNEDGSMNLYIMDIDGSNVRKITHTTSCYNGGPFFSPDGNSVVFRADPDKPHYLQLYLVDIEGKYLRQLTHNDAVNWAPYWHPSGKVIAYTTSVHGHGHYEIYLLNPETSTEYRLTYHPSFDGLPVFSNDGKKILWTSKRGDETSQLFLADFTMPDVLQKEF